jgi:ubiquinone/menaquinone biosynthesis C-methylase UbiE
MSAPEHALTDRQRRELEYHRGYAGETPLPRCDFSVIYSEQRRWWNYVWSMYTRVRKVSWAGKKAVVVGCGFGIDAVYLAKLGAEVEAFDLSPEMIVRARLIAAREGVTVTFDSMPAERTGYADGTFDAALISGVLHHCDIPETIKELRRILKNDGLVIITEPYTHSMPGKIRASRFVSEYLYPRMRALVYGNDHPYITEDERKLTEMDLAFITGHLRESTTDYFNMCVQRIIPDRWLLASKLDRLFLMCVGPLGRFLADRVTIIGRLKTQEP